MCFDTCSAASLFRLGQPPLLGASCSLQVQKVHRSGEFDSRHTTLSCQIQRSCLPCKKARFSALDAGFMQVSAQSGPATKTFKTNLQPPPDNGGGFCVCHVPSQRSQASAAPTITIRHTRASAGGRLQRSRGPSTRTAPHRVAAALKCSNLKYMDSAHNWVELGARLHFPSLYQDANQLNLNDVAPAVLYALNRSCSTPALSKR